MKKVGVFAALCAAVLVASGCADEGQAEAVSIFESVDEIPEVVEVATEATTEEPEVFVDTFVMDEIQEDEFFEKTGIHSECFDFIENVIETDIENGFTSAQLAVIRNGKLIYENAWGRTNTYNQDGTLNTESNPVTVDTLYDLASVSKMFGVNYAIQKMVTDGVLSVDDLVVTHLGPEFAELTMDFQYAGTEAVDIETMKAWKSELTIAELLKHQGGFPADPRYGNPHVDQVTQEYDSEYTNILFSGNTADEASKAATLESICKTPLLYEPGTKTLYSDVENMILGFIVEKVSGMDLDSYIKKNFCEPLNLTHVTYNPLDNGFSKEDCAATELNGNTRDGYINFEGIRTYTLQGEVHDEKAYYCMGGVSGHAGLFGNATDVAKLGTLMLTGQYNDKQFFSQEVIDMFTAPKSYDAKNWGLGWWRQGEMQRTSYFGTKAGSGTIGHQGWTGTLVMIDPEKELVIAFLTNKINSPVTNKKSNPNKFDGNWYTTAKLGFVAETLYIGMDEDVQVNDAIYEYAEQLLDDAKKSIKRSMWEDHPARRNVISKEQVLEKLRSNT